MLWLTSIVAMTIAVTRIHRHLADFSSETPDAWSKPSRRSSNLGSNGHVPTLMALVFLQNRVEALTHTSYEKYQTLLRRQWLACANGWRNSYVKNVRDPDTRR
ncbi:hypothetical protein BC827DRAFT_753623 [Russula dissimulans]|nr:hypothetical protein BC827DRAFT_753623 [Russula dissimulans]